MTLGHLRASDDPRVPTPLLGRQPVERRKHMVWERRSRRELLVASVEWQLRDGRWPGGSRADEDDNDEECKCEHCGAGGEGGGDRVRESGVLRRSGCECARGVW